MALRIVNNIAALNTQRWLSVSDSGMKKSLERLSSGYRINRAADDAAGLAISQSFRADIASFKVASRNTSEASSLLQVGEGAMDQIGNMLTRLKELATQAASANAATNVDKIEAEKQELIKEIDRIASVTEYAGSKLIDGTFGKLPYEFGTVTTVSSTMVSTDIETKYGNEFVYTNVGTAAGQLTSVAEFTFSDSVTDLAAATYTLNTLGASLTTDGVSLTGGSATYYGQYDATDQTLTFASLGLTITYDDALTATAVAADTITVADIGFNTMEIESSATSGLWTITDTGTTIKLTNGTTSENQTLTVGSGAETLEFDALGITLKLNEGYTKDDLDGHKFDVSAGGVSTFQVGSGNTSNDRVDISLGNATASGLGINNISFLSAAEAQAALDTIDSAISGLATTRGNVGAAQNRLGYAAANLATMIENVQAAESVIRDVD
ncbi:MAG: hypothetical protein KAV83_03935, partial [Desulfobacterales bacterium]|nr:hypothetical protein [Desulfobacterales bacterium]